MPELGELAYTTYVTALGMEHLCRFAHLHADMQAVWAQVEAVCQGQTLRLPPYLQPLLLENHTHE